VTTERIMQVLKLAVGIGSDWAEVDADEIEGEVPKEAPAVTPTRALEVIRDYGLPLAGLDRTALDALPPAAQECAALLCIEARRERWAAGFDAEPAEPAAPAREHITNDVLDGSLPGDWHQGEDCEGLDLDGGKA